MNKILIGTSLIVSALSSACNSSPANRSAIELIGIANPLNVYYCKKIVGSSITKKEASENEVGYCKFPDNTAVNDWELYRSAHQENQQNLIINYDLEKKQNVLKVIEAQKMQIIYDLNNMNIIVVSIPQSDIQAIAKYLEKIDGVFDVQEDSKMELQ